MQRDEYERMYAVEEHHWWFLARRDLLMMGLSRFPLPERRDGGPARVLDVGCGTGGTMIRLAEAGLRPVGLDVEPLALARSRERGLHRLALASATALPFASGAFDAVIAMDVLEHISDDGIACREIARVLRPGGALFVTVPAYPALWSSHDVALMHRRRYVRSGFAALLGGAGLQIEYLTHVVAAFLPVAAVVRILQRIRRGSAPPLPRADTALPRSSSVNRLLYRLHQAEVRLALRRPLPCGLSLFAVARAGGQADPGAAAPPLPAISCQNDQTGRRTSTPGGR